ncbi:vesicle transport v-SNARE VTI1 family protein [Skeletonema marinoi]|uniref:Vesicle transport v-SNARE VTI1 family protein n=1 Tax=Skeletonema marinoi TaxID=267567 RepID=A0AAD8Y5M5_9STRA|nr:vesicle transport v-SNARE VTI1 family protein [Skeletonema marinoi]
MGCKYLDEESRDRLKQRELDITPTRKETMTTTSSFDAYKSEFLSTMEQIKSKLQSKNNVDEVDEMLKQGEDLVKQMGLEARGMDDAVVKRDLLSKVKEYKVQLANLRSEYDFATLTKVDNDNYNTSSSIVDARSTIRSQNETLLNARSAIAETEGVAMGITEDLSRQRETMNSARGRVNEVSNMAERGDGILRGMLRRNKFWQGKLW